MLATISSMLFCSGETKDASQNLNLNVKPPTIVEQQINTADSSIKC